jgi:hypothetical protein
MRRRAASSIPLLELKALAMRVMLSESRAGFARLVERIFTFAFVVGFAFAVAFFSVTFFSLTILLTHYNLLFI